MKFGRNPAAMVGSGIINLKNYIMKTYKAKLKHDKGIVYIRVLAENEQEAIKRICDAEMCPERAIEKIIEIK